MASMSLLRPVLWRVPLLLQKIIMHSIGLSPVSGKQDLRTELTVAIIRSFMTFNHGIGVSQKKSMRSRPLKGPLWISNATFPPPPENDVVDAVVRAIEELDSGDETYEVPAAVPVEVEWTGYRSGVGKDEPLPDISEEEKYRELLKEAPADMVILYFHGGALCMMDPCTHRVPVAHLSKRTGAPVCSVRYRLAPQNPFPAALIDALVAYLSLISPPPGSYHKPVPANKIVFAGDSAGANLCLSLLQTLLTLTRTPTPKPPPHLTFHTTRLPLQKPAGVATVSPWCDLSRSMPSHFSNARFDYLRPPPAPAHTTFCPIPVPPDEYWPVTPPRVDFYAPAAATTHPLVSPLSAPSELWEDAPPVFVSVGEEALADEGLVVARRLARAGAPVLVEQFEGMPHCFGLFMISTPAGRRFFEGFAGFCRNAVAGRVDRVDRGEDGSKSGGKLTFIGFKLRKTKELSLDEIGLLSDAEVEDRLRRSRDLRVLAERELKGEVVPAKERARL